MMPTNLRIARQADLKPLFEIAEEIGVGSGFCWRGFRHPAVR